MFLGNHTTTSTYRAARHDRQHGGRPVSVARLSRATQAVAETCGHQRCTALRYHSTPERFTSSSQVFGQVEGEGNLNLYLIYI